MGATARHAGRLALIRRVDWRFLLPDAAFGTVLAVGPIDEVVLMALEDVSGSVIRPGGDGAGVEAPPDLVVTIAPDDAELGTAVACVASGGWIYVGSGARRTLGRPSLRSVVRATHDGGLVDIRRSWHWPSEASSLEIVPLDDARAVRMALDRRQSGRGARLKALLARVALRMGALDAIVPGWSVIARRPVGGAASLAADPIDSVRASLPGGREASVVLLTPRFRSSRHVIGLALPPDGEWLAAVVKLPRLTEDDGGIRREAAALARAAESGVTGVPEILALHGAPRPALVESALDGSVIASREVRARPTELLDEIEAWTRALAKPPSRRRVPLRTLWEPALERIALRVAGGATAADAVVSARSGVLDPSAISRLARRTALLLEPFGDVAVPVVLEHGDLAPPNLLRLRTGGLGAVDWEVADLDGLPLGDLLFFAAFIESDPSDGQGDRPGTSTLPRAGSAAIGRQAAHLGVDPSLVPVLALTMWARWADRQLARFVDDSTPFADRLPARHVRSWDAAAARLEVPR